MVIKFHLYLYSININIKQAMLYHLYLLLQYIHCQLPMQVMGFPICMPNNNNSICILSLSVYRCKQITRNLMKC